ncbi:hypothetical protein OG232_02470 [Streptomyces sp. NBC_01411]|uniref:hypothetical protein n=1 Tax=Streptomyces sp. NBC_01411 TaxID=2903857 RepID=UPI00324C6EE6
MPISQRLQVEELLYVGAYNAQLAAKFDFPLTPRQSDELVAAMHIGGQLLGTYDKYNPRTMERPNWSSPTPPSITGPRPTRESSWPIPCCAG